MKVLLDTDIGSDIDDALALLYLLARKGCELVGVTTVTGEALKRATLAQSLIRHMKKDIPVVAGAENPLSISQKQKHAKQAEAILNTDDLTDVIQEDVTSFQYRTICKYPGEVVLLCIGPLTNIANLFKSHPDAVEKLKEVVIMTGVFTNTLKSIEEWSTVEWNASLDPHALSIVLESQLRKMYIISLDVTVQLTIEKEDFLHHFSSEIFAPLHPLAAVWFENRDRITFHDPLAAEIIFNKHLCTYSPSQVYVELQSPVLAGFTIKKLSKESSIFIAETVDKNAFFKDFFATIDGYSLDS